MIVCTFSTNPGPAQRGVQHFLLALCDRAQESRLPDIGGQPTHRHDVQGGHFLLVSQTHGDVVRVVAGRVSWINKEIPSKFDPGCEEISFFPQILEDSIAQEVSLSGGKLETGGRRVVALPRVFCEDLQQSVFSASLSVSLHHILHCQAVFWLAHVAVNRDVCILFPRITCGFPSFLLRLLRLLVCVICVYL